MIPAPVCTPAAAWPEASRQASPSDDSSSSVRDAESRNGSPSSWPAMSSTARETAERSSSNCSTTEIVATATSPITSASPVNRASAAAGRSRWRRPRNHEATGDSAGAIVSAMATGSTITRRYQSSARISASAAVPMSSLQVHAAARSRFSGTGGTFIASVERRECVGDEEAWERSQPARNGIGTARCRVGWGRIRSASSRARATSQPNTNPPTCAKNATPLPSADGVTSAACASRSW